MNRILLFGGAAGAAILGFALMAGDMTADAGQRGGGCGGCYASSCDGGSDCSCSGGRQGLFARWRAKHASDCCGCSGAVTYQSCSGCYGSAYQGSGAAGGTGEVPPPPDQGDVPPPPDQGTAASFERAPMTYRQAGFRR